MVIFKFSHQQNLLFFHLRHNIKAVIFVDLGMQPNSAIENYSQFSSETVELQAIHNVPTRCEENDTFTYMILNRQIFGQIKLGQDDEAFVVQIEVELMKNNVYLHVNIGWIYEDNHYNATAVE